MASKKSKPKMTVAELRRTAIHEAGHAVMHIVLDLGCERVTIVPNYGELEAGHAAHGGEWGEQPMPGSADRCPTCGQLPPNEIETLRLATPEAFWLGHAVASYASAEALRRSGVKDWKAGADDDYEKARDAINAITSDAQSIDLLFKLAKRRCEVLVERYWPEITALAQALFRAKTLKGDRCKRIVSESLKKRGSALAFDERRW